jgi:hypothetical protein
MIRNRYFDGSKYHFAHSGRVVNLSHLIIDSRRAAVHGLLSRLLAVLATAFDASLRPAQDAVRTF